MTDHNTILRAFKLALEANGEKLGGLFERALFRGFLKTFPEAKEELLKAALDWLKFDDGDENDIGIERMQDVYNEEVQR